MQDRGLARRQARGELIKCNDLREAVEGGPVERSEAGADEGEAGRNEESTRGWQKAEAGWRRRDG